MDDQYLSSLEATLKQTLVPDSAVVKQAVAKLQKELYPNPLALPALVQLMLLAQDDGLKQLAAVETRKLVRDTWEKTDALAKQQVRDAVITQTFAPHPSKKMNHSCARIVALMADLDLELNQWPDLLPQLVAGVQGSDAFAKEMAVYTLYAMLETNPTPLVGHLGDFLDLFGGLLADPSTENRVNSVLALDVLSQVIEEQDCEPQLAAKFKQTVPGMVQVLKGVISANDDDLAKEIFNVFNSLIFVDGKLIGDHLVDIVQFMCEMAANPQVDEEFRGFALQFLISCVGYRKSRLSHAKLGPAITSMAVKIAAEPIDEEAELEGDDEEGENEELSPSSLALSLLNIMAAEMPPSQVIVPLFDGLQQLLPSQNKFDRRGGLLALKVASAGAPDFVGSQISKILPAIISGLKDAELIVKLAALRCLTALTVELQDAVTDYHEQLLPLIIDIINNATSLAIYKYACHALDGLIEFMSHDAMGNYVQPLMEKLTQMLGQANQPKLQTAIVSAIGSTAFAAGKAFTPYFNDAIRILEPYVANLALTEGLTDDDVELRAIAFENISTMARAVGSEAFSTYAKPLVEAAYHAVSSDNTRIREAGFGFIANMAKVYGPEFAGFLGEIVPHVLTCLQQEEFTINADYDAEAADAEESPVNIHTGITIEKEIAALALAELAKGTAKEFGPYVELLIKVLAEQVDQLTGMREAALQAMFTIVKAMFVAQYGADFKPPVGIPAQPYVDNSIMELLTTVRTAALDPLEYEFEVTMVATVLDGMASLIETVGAVAVVTLSDASPLQLFAVELLKLLKREHPCQVDDEDGPEEDDDQDASEVDAIIFENILEVLVKLAAALGGDFNEMFAAFKDTILSRMSSQLRAIRVACVGALSEISLGLKQANPYSQELLQVFIDRITNDKALEVKLNAAYGVGVVIENMGADVLLLYPQILELLFHMLNKADSKLVDDDDTKEVVNRSYANACGCVARMYLTLPGLFPMEHVLPAMLAKLPLDTGCEENTPIFGMILKLYEQNDATAQAQTPQVIKMFSEVFVKDAKRIKLAGELTLGREELLEQMKQFPVPGLREKVVELLKFLNTQSNGQVAADEVLKQVIA